MASLVTSERMIEMARLALRSRVRPLCPDAVSIAGELFDLDDDIARGERALVVLQASFAAQDAKSIAGDDKKVYEKELERRTKRLAKLARRRDEMLGQYAIEIIDSGIPSKSLAGFEDLFAPRR